MLPVITMKMTARRATASRTPESISIFLRAVFGLLSVL